MNKIIAFIDEKLIGKIAFFVAMAFLAIAIGYIPTKPTIWLISKIICSLALVVVFVFIILKVMGHERSSNN